jgi:transcriptional regulator with XRE-family HTH domain
MTFSERLKGLREAKGLTQAQLANLSGISTRMIQKYESGSRPQYDSVIKLSRALEISASELLGEAEMLIAEAREKYGARGAKQAEQLMSEVTGLFAGGEMAEEDMDVMMRAITEAYWIAKEKNKKYTPKRYKKHDEAKD